MLRHEPHQSLPSSAGAMLVNVPDQVARVVHKLTVPEGTLNAAGDW